MQALKEVMAKGKTTDANLIPCVGPPKVPQIASLLLCWDLEFLAVSDNDAEGKRITKELAEKLAVPEDKIIPVSNQDGNSIEDLFTHDDFNNFVLDDGKSRDKAVANSKFLKDQKMDKVLLSKKFFEKVKADKLKITLSQDTIKNFEVIFNKIATGFSNS